MRRDGMNQEEWNELRDLLNRWERSFRGGRKEFFDTDDYLRLSDYYLEQQKLAEAQNVLARGLKETPSNAELLLQRSRLLLYKGKKRDALDLLRKVESGAMAWNEDLRTETLVLKGIILVSMNKVWEAEQIFNTQLNVVRLDIKDEDELMSRVEMIENIAHAYQDADMRSRALGYLDLALDLIKRYATMAFGNKEIEDIRWDIMIQKLYVLMEAHDEESLKRAGRFGNMMLDENPYDEEVWFVMAQMYMQNGRFAEALEAYENLSAIDPSNDYPVLQKARALFHLKEYEKAISCLNQLLNWDMTLLAHYTEGDRVYFLQMRAECEDQMKRYAASARSYREAINELKSIYSNTEIDEKNILELDTYERNRLTQLYVNCGYAELKQENHDVALKYFKRAVQENATDTYALLSLADEELRLGNFTEAQKIYQQVIEEEPDNVIALAGASRVEINKGNYKKASVLLSHARRIFEDMSNGEATEDYEIYLLSAIALFCHYQMSKNQDATKIVEVLECLRKALKYNEEAIELFFNTCPSAMVVFSQMKSEQ
ncbi:MAG: tetratricopeptide repeat protein [Paludibacteraceae bacterium]|nr:tetratricopeptide repeat protein [Paludibacteraceae bacterium]